MQTAKRTYNVRVGRAIGAFTGILVSGAMALAMAPAPAAMQQVGNPLAAPPADPAIASAISQVSPAEIREIITSLVDFRTRNTLSSMTPDLPSSTGVTPAAKWIEQRFQQISAACHDCLEVKTDTYTEPADTSPRSRIKVPTTLTNVYAVLRGSDPAQAGRMYLVTGHYDSRASDVMDPRAPAPGANDDASGVAVSLESARVLSQHRWPATIVFVAVAGEEQGLNGSKHLATVAKEQGWQLAGVLNDDIVGGDTTPGDAMQDKSRVRVFSQGIPSTATPEEIHRSLTVGLESDGPSRELARVITEVGRTYLQPSSLQPVMVFRLDRYLRGGDHSSFNQLGFAAVRFTEWRENFDHQHQNVRMENGKQYGDLLQYVDFDYVAKVARLNAATLATLASAPAAPADVRIVTTDLDNNSTLHWKGSGSAGEPATHWDVVWRETSAPDWQFHQPVPEADASKGAFTLPVSKDNAIFGLRACNQAGECSAAVVPLPER
ncbi:MAG: Leucine aminopeptidase-related protein [Acidobacteriaceae bacterium]|nr:Leucine aminopeptidase-related protein [Acidobacteriaceae bacterium]